MQMLYVVVKSAFFEQKQEKMGCQGYAIHGSVAVHLRDLAALPWHPR